MSQVDFTDDAVVDTTPDVAMKAVLNEIAGQTHWWAEMEQKVRGGVPAPGEPWENKIVDAVLHGMPTTKFTYKVIKLVDGKSILTENLAGPYIGTGEWSFEPVEGGKTRVRYTISGQTQGIWALFPKSMGQKQHTKVTQNALRSLNKFLGSKN